MGNQYSLINKTTAINQAGDFVAFSGVTPSLNEFGAFVYKNDGGTWAQFGSTGRVKEQSDTVIGYTGTLGETGINVIVAYCDISENAHFLCVSNPLVGQAGGVGVGFTGAAFIFEFDTGTTGYGTPTQQLRRLREPQGDYPGYGGYIKFGPPISAGMTDSLFISNEYATDAGGITSDPFFRAIYDIWEYNGSSWVLNEFFNSTFSNASGFRVRHHYNTASKSFFSIHSGNETIQGKMFVDENTVFSLIIDDNVSSLYDISCSGNGLILYVSTNGGKTIRVYTRDSIESKVFNFIDSYTSPAGDANDNFQALNFYQANNTGSRLMYHVSTDGSLIYNILPEPGAGGASQHAYISNGSDGTSTQGGVGVNNPNAKSDVKIASGGGYGGASSTIAALDNTGSGGAGRYNTSGTAGSSGFINVRRWNSGI